VLEHDKLESVKLLRHPYISGQSGFSWPEEPRASTPFRVISEGVRIDVFGNYRILGLLKSEEIQWPLVIELRKG